jgi:hypothetical protein
MAERTKAQLHTEDEIFTFARVDTTTGAVVLANASGLEIKLAVQGSDGNYHKLVIMERGTCLPDGTAKKALFISSEDY